MTLMTPASSQPRAIPSPTAGGIRQILAVVDIDTPVEPLVRRAVAESSAHAVPLHVIVLYPRIPGLLVAAEHLNSGAGPNPVAPEPGPSADDLRHFERSSV